MFVLKIVITFLCLALIEAFFSRGAWAWGPAIHTAISCSVLDNARQILPEIAAIIQNFSMEYIYGNLAADFFIGKGQKRKKGHSHNWETGFKLLSEAESEREASYAYGFLSHLAADVVAHNYFVPDYMNRLLMWKRVSHFYTEAVADKYTGPFYLKMAMSVLEMKDLGCDRMLKAAVIRNSHGLKAKKQIYTQSLKVSDYLYYNPQLSFVNSRTPERISVEYMTFMIGLAFRLVRDLLSYPDSSPCLDYDPIGEDNLRIAGRKGVISKIMHSGNSSCLFPVDEKLLNL
jgi:hypothetical protein